MPVIKSTCEGELHGVSAETADAAIAAFEADPFYVVRHVWDQVSYSVSVEYAGDTWPFVAYLIGHDDVSWREGE